MVYKVGKARAGMLALMALIGSGGKGYCLDFQVGYDGDGKRAQVRVLHSAATEPLAAIKLRLVLKPGAGAKSVTTFKAEAGPWSQFLPQAAFADGHLIAYAMAPATGIGKDSSARTVAIFELALSPTRSLATAADLIDSAVVVEAYGPDGKPLNLAKRLTTAVGKARAMMNGAPVERVRGKQRTLAFNLGRAQRVQAWVMDLSGRRVAGIVDRKMPAGVHEITWDGMAEGGKPLAKGTYLLRLQAGGFAYDSKVEVGP